MIQVCVGEHRRGDGRGAKHPLGRSGRGPRGELHAHVRAPLSAANLSTNAVFSGTLQVNTFQASNSAQVRLDCGPLASGGNGSGGSGNSVTITAYTEP